MSDCGCDGGFGFGGGFAFIVVLFILLVIVGASLCGGAGFGGRCMRLRLWNILLNNKKPTLIGRFFYNI